MTTTNLLNTTVVVTISDPWEFGTRCGVGPFPGRIVDQRSDAVAVKLDAPLLYDGRRLAAVIVRARHVSASLGGLGDGEEVVANFLFTVSEDVSLAPGVESGVAAIGSVRQQQARPSRC